MAKKRKVANTNDAIERKLNALTAAVLSMMQERGQGASQTFQDFNQQDVFENPSPEMFSSQLAGDTVMEGPISDYAADAVGKQGGMSREVAGRAGDKYMQDVYKLIMKNMGNTSGRKGSVR